MKLTKTIVAIFKSYDFRDKVLSTSAVAVFLAMIVKMMFFPYGMFNFGASDIYTEGLVSRSGIQNLNPLFVDYNEADREVSAAIFSGLMKYDPEKKAVVDDMASLAINEDKTEYTFTIREGIKWHDGKDFTSEDVLFTFNDIVLHPSFPNEILKINFEGVKVEMVDNRTVIFRLEKPNVFFITNLTTGILPKHILEGVDPYDILQHEFNKKPIGTGSYMVTEPASSFSDGRTQITLTRNLNYYGDVSEIEHLRFIAYPTMNKLVEELNAVNGVVKVTGKYILDFENDDRFTLYPYELPQYTAVFMNMDSPILKDQIVRLALQKAVDKKALIGDNVDKITVDTPLMELDQGEWIYQSSLEQAQGALKEAGFVYPEEDVNKQGIRYNADGVGLELNFIVRLYEEDTYQYEETLKVVTFLQEIWEGIGCSVQVEFLPEDVFKERIMKRQYDLLLVGQILGYNLDTYSTWHSAQASPLGQNLSNYRSFQVDKIIEDIRSTFDPEKKAEKLKELAEKLKEDVPAIFLFKPIYYYASDGKVSGISMKGVVYPSDRLSGVGKWEFEW